MGSRRSESPLEFEALGTLQEAQSYLQPRCFVEGDTESAEAAGERDPNQKGTRELPQATSAESRRARRTHIKKGARPEGLAPDGFE
jgi:hypothetical protein